MNDCKENFGVIDLPPCNIFRCWPLEPVAVWSGSALPLTVAGIPQSIAGGNVKSVSFTVTNADGLTLTAAADSGDGGIYFAIFAEGNFSSYGYIEKGVKIKATVSMPDGGEANIILAVADLEIAASSPSASPGDPSKTFVAKGSDQYIKTETVEGVQHYAKITLHRDPRVNSYLARYTGDYILVNGEFQEVD